jgi:hypothetical protein
LDSGGLEAPVAGYERKAKVEGSCSDDAVGHIGHDVAGNGSQGASNVVIERKDFEGRIVAAHDADKPLKCIGGDAPAFDQVHNFNERDGRM